MQVKDIYSSLQYTDFARYYTNDFNYVFNWQSTVNYLIGDKSSQLDTKNYKHKIFNAITNNLGKEPLLNESDWDFLGLEANANYVLQSDIEKQLAIAKELFPDRLFYTFNPDTVLQYFYLLVAFLIVADKKRVNNGIAAGINRFVSSRTVGVGSVSESFEGVFTGPRGGALSNSQQSQGWYYDNSYGRQYYDFIYDLAQTQKINYVIF
jgi:hypothetical protein